MFWIFRLARYLCKLFICAAQIASQGTSKVFWIESQFKFRRCETYSSLSLPFHFVDHSNGPFLVINLQISDLTSWRRAPECIISFSLCEDKLSHLRKRRRSSLLIPPPSWNTARKTLPGVVSEWLLLLICFGPVAHLLTASSFIYTTQPVSQVQETNIVWDEQCHRIPPTQISAIV